MDAGATILAWATAIEKSAAGDLIRGSVWIYPWSNVLHVLGVALLLGAIAALDLRLLGVLRATRPADAAALLLPVAKVGFALALPTGLVLFVAEAGPIVGNPIFLAKFAAIGIGIANIVLFHRGRFRDVASWEGVPASARLAALVSLAAWTAAAICGRYAAYA
ncbi:hypothetical protein STAQ_01230 [Allostella sp. ATCC 35155]|nr:hypothetical protein STAQ_01230 [Stella sp. ATCC 35155]